MDRVTLLERRYAKAKRVPNVLQFIGLQNNADFHAKNRMSLNGVLLARNVLPKPDANKDEINDDHKPGEQAEESHAAHPESSISHHNDFDYF